MDRCLIFKLGVLLGVQRSVYLRGLVQYKSPDNGNDLHNMAAPFSIPW